MTDLTPEPLSDLDQEAVPDVDGRGASGAIASPLIEPDQGWIADDEAAVVASEAVGDVGPLSPEEAAIHVVSEDEAPGVTLDDSPGYVDENPVERPDGFGDVSSSPADP